MNLFKKNAKEMPKVFFGLHFVEGVAEYDDGRLLVSNEAANKMDSSFAGKPVYVHHVDRVDLDQLQEQADGYVVKSFYNAADGKHWAEFLVVSDKAHSAIRNGWKLSNAYKPTEFGPSGSRNSVTYDKEVINGEFLHLAIVPNPRYDQSVILTPEQFKEYNAQKFKELQNSKGEDKMLGFLKKPEKEELEILKNDEMKKADDDSKKSDDAKKSDDDAKKADDAEKAKEEKSEPAKSDEDLLEKIVTINEEEMTIKELIKKYLDVCDELAKKNEPKEEKKEEVEQKKNSKFYDDLKNANHHVQIEKLELSMDRLARGKSRYGSGK